MTTQMIRLTTPNNFSLKKIVEFFVGIGNAFIRARQLQAATEIAISLKSHNKDFKHMSHHDIVQQIMGDVVKERE